VATATYTYSRRYAARFPDLGNTAGDAYLVLDVDRGEETLNVRPDDALVTITARGRRPLTVLLAGRFAVR